MLSILSLLVILIVCYHVIQSFTLQVSSSAEKYIYNNEIPDLQSEEKDYIKKPKQNGYRSLHLIIETPIYLSNGKKNMIVEVQIRTIAQNFWAALEHQLRYKKNIDEKKSISLALKLLAEESASIDTKMELLKKRIYKDNKQ